MRNYAWARNGAACARTFTHHQKFIEGQTPRISDGFLDRTRKLGRVILYPGRSTTNANALYRVLCTESCVQERFCGKVIPPKYKRPMLRNIGRFYRSTDGSNIPFRGEASYDLAISEERVTQVF